MGHEHLEETRSPFVTREGDQRMKDTDHQIRHPRSHLGDRASSQRIKRLRMARRPIWTRAKHLVGLERPHFLPLARAQKSIGVAPAQSIRRAVKAFRWTDRGSTDAVFSRGAGRTSSFLLVFLNNRGRGEELFTPLLHRGLHQSLHGGRVAMARQINSIHAPKRTEPHADRNHGRAGATPPFDARCVTGFVRSLPPA